MCVCVSVFVYLYHKEAYCEELACAIIETENSHNEPSVCKRHRKTNDIFPSMSSELRNRGIHGLHPSLSTMCVPGAGRRFAALP